MTNRKIRKQIEEMTLMVDFIKTARELDGLLKDTEKNKFEFVKGVQKMTEAAKKYEPKK